MKSQNPLPENFDYTYVEIRYNPERSEGERPLIKTCGHLRILRHDIFGCAENNFESAPTKLSDMSYSFSFDLYDDVGKEYVSTSNIVCTVVSSELT